MFPKPYVLNLINPKKQCAFMFKARSQGAFFFCAFAMQKTDYVGVNEGVHTV